MTVFIEIAVLLIIAFILFLLIVILSLPFFCIYDTIKYKKNKIFILMSLIPIIGWIFVIYKSKPRFKEYWDGFFYSVILFAALCSILFLFGIILSLFVQGSQIFYKYGFFKFLFGNKWHPTSDPPVMGILPMITGSFLVTFITLIIAVPFGLGASIYISEIAKPNEKEFLKPIIELLAGIPSVIFGLWGMKVLAPFIQQIFGLKTGYNAFSASLILGIMIIPIISSISEDAINSVPRNLKEASLALGANKWETIIKVVIPAAKSGIITAIILGIGRAIGETMVVLMVAGNSPIIPTSIFDSVRPMTSTIAAEMGEAAFGDLHNIALFGIGIILFLITFILNMITEGVRENVRKQHAAQQ